jgi:hypothetical protein
MMRLITFNSSLIAAMLYVGPSWAADLYTYEPLPPITEPGGFEARWEVGAAMYLWAAGVEGTTGFGGLPPADVDASFSDILDNLDFAYMGIVEARYGRFGIFNDLIYTKISAGGTVGPASLSLGNELFVATLMGEYRVVEQGNTTVDLMAGGRLWYVGIDVEVSGGGYTVGTDADEVWVDPMIGVKGRFQGASPWYLTTWGMIGGFGVSSDLAWDVFGGVGYDLNDRWSLVGGYRALGVDYEDSDFKFDIIMNGPIFGGVFRF